MEAFDSLLRSFRLRSGLSAEELAAAARLSLDTIRSYETGRRRPRRRDAVIDLADALDLSPEDTNLMMDSLQFPRVPDGRMKPLFDRRRPLSAAQEECETYSWPCLVTNENFDVIAWNQAANDLSELDFGTDLAEPGARHLLRMALSPWYRDKLVNWDDVIGVLIRMYKTEQLHIEQPEDGTPDFNALVGYVAEHHPTELPHLFEMWTKAIPWVDGWRGYFPADWRTSEGVDLHFNCTVTTWSDFDATWAFDWQPADGATWNWLDARRKGREEGESPIQARAPGRSSWREMLRYARESLGLTRAAAAIRCGVGQDLIEAYEMGRRSPTRDRLVALCDGMVIDGATQNTILEAAGFEGEPSNWALFVSGNERRSRRQPPRQIDHPTVPQIAADIAKHPWPCIIVDDHCDIICENDLAVAATGIDIRNLPNGPARNLLALVTDQEFRARVDTWGEAVSSIFPGTLRVYVQGQSLEGKTAAHFSDVVAHVLEREKAAGRGDEALRSLYAVWRANPRGRLCARVSFPLQCHTRGAQLRFNALLTTWNLYDPRWAIDLHPADAATWAWLGQSPGS